MPQTPITYEDAEVTRDSDFGFFCRVAGRKTEFFVGEAMPLTGTTVRRQRGDRGRLIIPRWFAEQNGLPIPPEHLK